MKRHIFISYPHQNQEIVENLACRLQEVVVEAWVYSLDRTLAEEVWGEIENKVQRCKLFIFVASKNRFDAGGQHRELQLVVNRLRSINGPLQMMPIPIDDVSFTDLPEELRHVNGLKLDAYTVNSTAQEIAKTFFPDLFETNQERDWWFPRPGQWLGVCNVDQWTEEYWDLGDLVYFRRLSPLGLFECYAPKLNGLFWFAPKNLRATDIVDEDGTREREQVPWWYRYGTSYDCEGIGIEEMRKRGKFE
jgi:hypothetical protein